MHRRNFIKYGSATSLSSFLPFSRLLSSKEQQIHEAIIVGTGYGASVTALRLAQKGIPVLMLEMGQDWSNLDIPFAKVTKPNKFTFWKKKKSVAPFGNIFHFNRKYTGVLDRVDFANMKVYLGRCVGGGSIVNGGMAVTPLQKDFADAFPQLSIEEFYKKYFLLAEKTLKVNRISSSFYESTPFYHFSRTGERQAKEAGFKTRIIPNVYDFEYMEKEAKDLVPKSALDGEVIYGNNHGKFSLDKTYLKEAKATGLVTILPLHKVDLIKEAENGRYELAVQELDNYGEIINKKSFKCKKLFLCAGSLGSTALLVKSKAHFTLNNLHESVGTNWGNNGNVMTGRNFVKGGVGRRQSTIPVASIDNRHDESNYFLSEIAPLPMKMETWTTLYLMINKVKNNGRFFYNKNTKKVELDWSTSNAEGLRSRAKYFVKSMNKSCDGTRSILLFNKGIGENICYHPLGGCVLGEGTDNVGRLRGYQNFYVIDSSLIPGSIGANPFLTITAISEYCIENIIAEDFV